jgi:hypothetical protein
LKATKVFPIDGPVSADGFLNIFEAKTTPDINAMTNTMAVIAAIFLPARMGA